VSGRLAVSPSRCLLGCLWSRYPGIPFIGPNSVVSICARKSSALVSRKNPCVEVPGVVDHYVDTPEAVDGSAHGGSRGGGVRSAISQPPTATVIEKWNADASGCGDELSTFISIA
jgi:hypothetical protein